MSTNTGFIQSTKSSDLRALANNLKVTNESSVSQGPEGSNVSHCSMPSKSKLAESCSLPEKPPSKIPQPNRNILAPAAKPRKSHQQVLTQNRVRALETQYQTLQCLQTAFFEKLQSLGPVESKMLGSYKFVAIVLKEDSKWVYNTDVAQKLPSDCVQELKNCCQAAIDSGFTMFYDHLEHIQMARNEQEACEQKEQLTGKLKDLLHQQMGSIVKKIEQVYVMPVSQDDSSANKHLHRYISELRDQKQELEARLLQNNREHNSQINRLKAELEGQLMAAEGNWQQTLVELKEMLQLCEAQNNEDVRELSKQKAFLAARDNTIASMKAEMDKLISRNLVLEQLVKESKAMVVQAHKEVERKRESMVGLEEELKEERQHVVQLQKSQDADEKDQIIHNLKRKILALMQFKCLLHRQLKNTRSLQAGNEMLDTKIQLTRAEISELQENLKSTEVQLDASYKREQQLHSHLKHVKSELFRSEQLVMELQEEAKPTQADNQTKIDNESANDPKINQMSIQLKSKEEELRHVIDNFGYMQGKLRCMEESIKLLTDQNDRLSKQRDRQREKELLMEREISQLMDSIKVYQDHISISRKSDKTTKMRGCCINKPMHSHGNYFRPLHKHLAQQQSHRHYNCQHRAQNH